MDIYIVEQLTIDQTRVYFIFFRKLRGKNVISFLLIFLLQTFKLESIYITFFPIIYDVRLQLDFNFDITRQRRYILYRKLGWCRVARCADIIDMRKNNEPPSNTRIHE